MAFQVGDVGGSMIGRNLQGASLKWIASANVTQMLVCIFRTLFIGRRFSLCYLHVILMPGAFVIPAIVRQGMISWAGAFNLGSCLLTAGIFSNYAFNGITTI